MKNGELDDLKTIVESQVRRFRNFRYYRRYGEIFEHSTLNQSRKKLEIVIDLKRFSLFQNIQINQDVNGRMLLHYAADYGQSEVVSYLISRGANVNVSRF